MDPAAFSWIATIGPLAGPAAILIVVLAYNQKATAAQLVRDAARDKDFLDAINKCQERVEKIESRHIEEERLSRQQYLAIASDFRDICEGVTKMCTDLSNAVFSLRDAIKDKK